MNICPIEGEKYLFINKTDQNSDRTVHYSIYLIDHYTNSRFYVPL